jgi:cell wall-associated NlpC family hydrolase
MVAWAQGGVRLTHGAIAQYAQTARVAIADLKPGDLVFYGRSPSTIHHVGLYIGNGQMIHAPRTGDVVRIASIYYMSDLMPSGGRP